MSRTGIDHITNHAEMITADDAHWCGHAHRNFDKVLNLVLLFTCKKKPKCIFCGDQSLSYSSLAKLAAHYRYAHKTQCVLYYLDEIIKIKPAKLEKLYKKNGNSIMMEKMVS